MGEPAWVSPAVVLALHEEQLAEHGGLPGLRDAGLLASALDRPRNLHLHEAADLPALAAAYEHGLARNHPFRDGNKRASFVVTELFLALDGLALAADDDAVVREWRALAAGLMDQDALAAWLRAHVRPGPRPPART